MNYYSIYKSSEFKTINLRKSVWLTQCIFQYPKKTGIVSYGYQMLMVILKKDNIYKKGGIRSKIGGSRSEKGLNKI